jgi:toxin ParE1/3/4
MARVQRTAAARNDYKSIHRYIAEDDPDAARRVIQSFDDKLELLAKIPGAGVGRQDLQPGMRCFPVGNYVLYYRELPQGGGIELVRVIHGARDVSKIFRRKKR